MLRAKSVWILPAALILCLLGLIQLRAPAAQAQCGTQASSCKNCHEVQAKAPVNTKGAWHSDHAFGDFCEFCHAGNVQAKDETAAHQGMVAWNADVKASCATCHAADYEKRAGTYAETLGVELNTGKAAAAPQAGAGAMPAASAASAACAPLGGEEIDYNLLYTEETGPKRLAVNWGNIILGMMTLGMGMVFAGTVWTWEGWGAKVGRWIKKNVRPVTDAMAEVSRTNETHKEDDGGKPAA